MSDQAPGSARDPLTLPDNPNLDWLRKQARRRLQELRQSNAATRLADAQLDLARQYGFSSWRALKAHIDSHTVDGQLFDAARKGDLEQLVKLLDEHPDKLYARMKPYAWTLLHTAASNGHLACVDLLLKRGLDPNTREKGDDTYAMHWAAATGRVDVVRRLADAGGDVIGQGDDHQLEVIGWATCWDGCDDDAHREVAEFLLSRGARHHIFSAIAMNLADEVRRIVANDPSALNRRMSRNENNQLPLHFAVRMKRPDMVSLLIDLGADPLAVDGSGNTAAVYATEPDIDQRVMEKIRGMTTSELISAERGHRPPRSSAMDLLSSLALGDTETAERLLRENPRLLEPDGTGAGLLHLAAKRGDARAVKWLLDHHLDANGRWLHWDAQVTPLHLAVLADHPDIVRILLDAGADPHIRDSKHDADAIGWAEFFKHRRIVQILEAHVAKKN